jgi:hypothetical protein
MHTQAHRLSVMSTLIAHTRARHPAHCRKALWILSQQPTQLCQRAPLTAHLCEKHGLL